MRFVRTTTHLALALATLAVAPQLALAATNAAADTARPSAIPSPKGDGKMMYPMRRTTQAERSAAAIRAQKRISDNEAKGRKAGPNVSPVMKAGAKGAFAALLDLALAQVGPVDLFASPNFALSALPTAQCVDANGNLEAGVTCQKDADCPGYLPPFMIGPYQFPGGDTCTGPVVSGGMRKFVDGLPGICGVSPWDLPANKNCMPLATPDKTTFPGSDYYEIGIAEYRQQLHSDLPALGSQIRGYYQKNATGLAAQKKFYGPLILAEQDRPVRVKFVNELPTGAAGNLFIPMDGTLSGVGNGPDGSPYTQNRVAIHLHGGNTPWISDGTQHQWTAPVGEVTNNPKGVSVGYPPDMWYDAQGNVIAQCSGLLTCNTAGASNNPGPGMLSHYYSNHQSGRLMWYHDHAYGITRLNAYVGMAAGYLLRTPADEDDLRNATVPGTLGTNQADWDVAHLVPLVIVEKTFVPPAAQMAQQDPSWDYTAWGGEGNFWYPHVYTTNQWPGNPDLSGNNPFGRWDYGPWFWPVQSTLVTRQGVQRPLTVPCTSAAAVTDANPNGDTDCPSTPNPSIVPESFLDTPLVNGTPYPTLTVDPAAYRFMILNASQERNWNLSWFVADSTGTEVTMLPATVHSSISPDMPLCPEPTAQNVDYNTGLVPGCWPRLWPWDQRQGGVPDPRTAGPLWLQIGTEGGLLPNTAYIAAQPVDYEYNRRNVIVLNVKSTGLFLGPAERADVVVDFTPYAGQTLILYNDSPAPVPAADPRQDFFTWGPDLTASGGSPTPLPGYGPNTRTVMQVKVRSTPVIAGQTPVNRAAIDAVLPVLFERNQPPLIVPESAYNNVYNPATPYADTYLAIQSTSLTFTPITKNQAPAQPITLQLGYKALHELFDGDYGRMNSLLAVEIPMTNWLNQTTIPWTNYDPVTEYLVDGQPQIWKITHNGVDTHTIHFHLVNVQLINRVGWDGSIYPPDQNELGWKEAVRFHPLEDAFVALLPVKDMAPWPVPDKIRPLDVDEPLGTTTQFTGVDIYNNPINVSNQLANFGWEYVWHCHLLGHEEGDMLRSEVFVTAPEIPTGLTANRGAGTSNTGNATLAWNDASLSALTFDIQRSTAADFSANVVSFTAPAPAVQPGPVTFVDPGPLPETAYYYRIRSAKALTSIAIPNAVFAAQSNWTDGVPAIAQPKATLTPPTVLFANRAIGSTSPATAVTLTNTGALALAFTSATIVGTDATSFTTTNNCPASIAVGAFCTINVSFAPKAPPGAKSASLQVVTNDPVNPTQLVTLAGTGTAGVATVSPLQLAFGVQAVGTSTTQVVRLTNTGNGPLAISGTTISSGGTDFSRTTTCGTSLAAGSSCNVTVRFAPTTTGTKTGDLRITTNSNAVAGTATNVPLYGNYSAATAVSLTPSVPSPQMPGTAVTFTAVGSGSTGLPATGYQYQFTRDGSIVQTWSYASTWIMPGTTPSGTHTIQVDVRVGSVGGSQATNSVSYVIGNAPATGVTFSVINPASPQTYGTPVVFTAQGQGGTGTYQYQFSLDGTVTQAWSTAAQWSMPASTAGGSHTVRVDVSTTVGGPSQANTSTTYVLNYPAATGVVIDAGSPASPQPFGTAVTFTAAGSSSVALPASAYQYRFTLDNGTPGAWSSSATYVMPGTTPMGTHTVTVDVTTEATPATVQASTTSAIYTVSAGPATGVAFTSVTPAAPQLAGTAVTFTAAGSGSQQGATYQYQFSLDGTVVQPWSTTASYTMPGTATVATHTIQVDVSTALTPSTAQATASTTYDILASWPAATGVTLTSSLPSPQPTAPTIVFTATGSSSVALPANAYKYYWQVNDVNGWRVVQNWSTSNTWTLPAGSTAGYYNVVVLVSTANPPVEQKRAAYVMYYGYSPATSITVTTDLPSPQLAGTAVTFTAVAGPGPGPYEYQFLVYRNGLYVSSTAWGASNSYVLPGTSVAGNYSVYARARANNTSNYDVQTVKAFVIQ